MAVNPPQSQPTEVQATKPADDDMNLTLADWVGPADDAKTTTAEPAATAAQPTGTEPSTAGQQPAASAEPTTDPATPAASDPVLSMIDDLVKEDTTAAAAEAEKPADLKELKTQIETKRSELAHYEEVLSKADPKVNEDGSKLPDYQMEDGTDLYQLNKDQLNSVVTQLQNASQPVMAQDILTAWNQFHANKQKLADNRKILDESKTTLQDTIDNVEWAESAEQWKSAMKAKGFELTKEQLSKVDGYIAQRNEREPASKKLSKHQQIQDALKSTGVAAELRKAVAEKVQADGVQTTGAPDATLTPSKFAPSGQAGNNGYNVPQGYKFTEKQIRDMRKKGEYDAREPEIERAMVAGEIYQDI